jgi:hypothetical protein
MQSKIILWLVGAAFIALTKIADAGVNITLNFSTDNNNLSCNGVAYTTSPASCSFSNANKIEVKLKSWGKYATTLTLTGTNPATVSIVGDCVKSWIKNSATNYNLNSDCLPKPIEPPPRAHGELILNEWFADLPWHQKLSTKDSNLIDIPFVLPAAAIKQCQNIVGSPAKERCMLRYGIVNVMAMHRSDRLYLPGEAPAGQDCADGKCVEVMIEVQRVHTQTNDAKGYVADPVTNKDTAEIKDPEIKPMPSLGFAITEATIFAPWRPWYMGHYCAVTADNISDSVCYEDYFTTQLIAATNLAANEKWLTDHPVLFYPQTKGNQFGHFCQTTPSDKVNDPPPCPMFLGKVKFESNLTMPQINGCGSDCKQMTSQVNAKREALDNQFQQSLSEFADIGRFPWHAQDAQKFNPANAYLTNPFIGYYGMTQDRTDKSNYLFKATSYILPKLCTQQDFANARLQGDITAIERLKDCSLNFEIHTNGFYNLWKDLYGGTINDAAISEIQKVFNYALDTNQYGRTMFMYAGVPEQMISISYTASSPGGASIMTHDKIYGSSLYTQYLPMLNPDDQTQLSKYYTDDFWHAIFMSNHMNQTPILEILKNKTF